jgi:hypothetical protein
MATDFAVFILTHGRARNVKTYATLRKQGYTGPIYLIIDNEDDQADEYRRNYGDQVIQFDKVAIARTFDQGDNFTDRRAVIYARNASFQIARDLGVEYFLQLDDDYYVFMYRFSADLDYRPKTIHNLDGVFSELLDFYKATPALTVAMAQGGDFIGGSNNEAANSLHMKRKAMNSFMCSTSRPFQFMGRVNEDVNTYVTLGNRGGLFLTLHNVNLDQEDTQTQDGGMEGMYLDAGTYVKSFYTVMYSPSCVTISEMGANHRRIHHRINWDAAVPKIMNEHYRKAGHDGRTS